MSLQTSKELDDFVSGLITNAIRLWRDAILLSKNDRWISAITLSLYALEELGKLVLNSPLLSEGAFFKKLPSSDLHKLKQTQLATKTLKAAWLLAAAEYHGVSLTKVIERERRVFQETGRTDHSLSIEWPTSNLNVENDPLTELQSKALDAILANDLVLDALGLFSHQHSGQLDVLRKRSLYVDWTNGSHIGPSDIKDAQATAERLIKFGRTTLLVLGRFHLGRESGRIHG